MKHKNSWMSLFLLVALASCAEKTTTTSTKTSSSVDSSTGTTTGGTTGSTTGSTTGGTTGSTTGSTTGTTSGSSIAFNVMMAGQFSWYPGFYPGDLDTSQHGGDFVQIGDGNIAVFDSDSRFKVRVKVLDERYITSTDRNAVCYKRDWPTAQLNVRYSKLKFDVGIRNIIKNGSVYTLGPIYGAKNSGIVALNSYSPVMNWSADQFPTRDPMGPIPGGGGTIVGHTFVIFNVMSDAYCQSSTNNSIYCPVASHVSTRCWNVQAELSTDLYPGSF